MKDLSGGGEMNVIWKRPNFYEERYEIKRTADEENVKYRPLARGIMKGKLITLTDDIWMNLDNTDSWITTNLEKVLMLIDEYDRDIFRIIGGFFRGDIIPAPIVVKFEKDGRYYLVAGNTRLMVSRVFNIRPKIWFVSVDL